MQALWSELGIGRALSAGRGLAPLPARDRARGVRDGRPARDRAGVEARGDALGAREVVLPGVGELTDDGLYSAMDFLLECSERVQESVFFSVANLLNSRST